MAVRFFILAAAVTSTSGCDFPTPYIELAGHTPIPVDPEVDKILTAWEKHRSGKKSFYAEFNRTVVDKAFKEERRNKGSMRYRHADLGRIDISKDDKGKGREIILWTKSNELWHLMPDVSKASVHQFDRSYLLDFVRGSFLVWLVPADKATLQKHGRISKVKEDVGTVVLRVEVLRPQDRSAYESMTVHLRKSDYLPVKLIVRENVDVEVIYEFTALHNDVDLSESDFEPPKLDPKKWEIDRNPFLAAKPKPKTATKQ